jgi:hypothetical protein
MFFGLKRTPSFVVDLPQYLIMVANKHTLAGVQLQSILLTFLEKEIESCEQVIFCLGMEQTVF